MRIYCVPFTKENTFMHRLLIILTKPLVTAKKSGPRRSRKLIQGPTVRKLQK